VCEYGNNRIQLFSPDGESIYCRGQPGRRPGQLAYPWGLAVDARRRAYIVDAGNDRIQVWQLPARAVMHQSGAMDGEADR